MARVPRLIPLEATEIITAVWRYVSWGFTQEVKSEGNNSGLIEETVDHTMKNCLDSRETKKDSEF